MRSPHFPPENDAVAELEAQDYVIQKFSTTHWRITKEEHAVKVDVWPTVRKIYIVGDARSSYRYGNLYYEITRIFKRFEPKI